MSQDRPIVILFNPDQWRGDVMGHLGHPAAVTPTLDRLVAEGEATSFRWAFCQNPVCTPSRCSFATGWYPHTRGHRTMRHMLHPEQGERNMFQVLREQDYCLWWGGKFDIFPMQHGIEPFCDLHYDARDTTPEDLARWGYTPEDLTPERSIRPASAWRGEPGGPDYYGFLHGPFDGPAGGRPHPNRDVRLVRAAQDLLRAHAAGQGATAGRPLCVNLCMNYPHVPYEVERAYYDRIDPDSLPPFQPAPEAGAFEPAMRKGIRVRQSLGGWTEARWREMQRTYYAMCLRCDELLGDLIDTLQETGLYDDTALVLLSDHGDYTGDYGLVEKNQNTFEDCLARVPFVVKPPKSAAGTGGVSEALVELIDMPATIYDLLGIDPGYSHFGRSLLPMMRGEADAAAHRDAVFCEGGRLMGEEHCMERANNPELDPASMYWPRQVGQWSPGPDHGKAAMCRTREYKYVMRLYEPDQLYDLRKDPGETTDVAADPAYAETLHAMERRMLRWFMETADVVPYEPDARMPVS